ncbi:MAG: hypothetical protein ACREEM_37175, partial [Blastocatellia bacterium]
MTDQELRDIVAETNRVVLALGDKTNQLAQSIAEMRESLAEESRKTNEEIKKTNKVVQALAKQVGGVSNKFGGYTEGLAWASIERMLKREFGATHTDYNISRISKPEMSEVEVDALGWNRSEVYVVEVKSYLHSDELK